MTPTIRNLSEAKLSKLHWPRRLERGQLGALLLLTLAIVGVARLSLEGEIARQALAGSRTVEVLLALVGGLAVGGEAGLLVYSGYAGRGGRERRAAAREGSGARAIRLEASKGWAALQVKVLWEYRELLYFLTWRDIKVRYKQTVLGAGWAIIQPLLTMVVFSLFFGKLAAMPSDGIPYPLFSYAALVPWTFFANGLAQAGGSVVMSQRLVKKVYFPRLMLPVASVLGGVVDFALAFGVLLGLMGYYALAGGSMWLPAVGLSALGAGGSALSFSANLAWTPLLVGLAFSTALGAGLWLAALNVQFRDVKYLIPFLVQVWLFATPIAYPASLLPQPWRTLYGLNPMAGVVEGFRWALLGVDSAPGGMLLLSALSAAGLLLSGLFYFRRMERSFADVV